MNFADEIKSSSPPPRRQQKEAYFAEISAPPPEIKKRPIVAVYFPEARQNGADFFGIESNPRTRATYGRYGILSQSHAKGTK